MFLEVLVVAIVASTIGFIFKQFFDYLKFRRTKTVDSEDVEQLEAAMREYAFRTDQRIKHLEQIIADNALEEPSKQGLSDELTSGKEMQAGKMKNRLETR